jgi:TonB family protein
VSQNLQSSAASHSFPDRRSQPRQQLRSLTYVELGAGNGGIILNISEGGLSVQAVEHLVEDSRVALGFRPSNSQAWIKAQGRVAWIAESKTFGGIQFLDLTEEERQTVRNCVAFEASPAAFEEFDVQAEPANAVAEDPPPANGEPPLIPLPADAAAIAQPISASTNSGSPVTPPIASAAPAEPSIVAPVSHNSEPSDLPLAEPRPAGVPADVLTPGGRPAPLWPSIPRTSVPPAYSPARGAVPAAPARIVAERRMTRWHFSIAISCLATASLVAGFFVGRGAWSRVIGRIFGESWSEASIAAAATTHPASDPSAAPAGLAIEVVDLNERRWLVPFRAASPAKTSAPRPAPATEDRSTPEPAKVPIFQPWTPSAPVLPRSKARQAQKDLSAPAITQPLPSEAVSASIGAISGRQPLASASSPLPPPPDARISTFRDGELIRRANPIYPPEARRVQITGVVKLRVTVGTDGSVKKIDLMSGPKILVAPAIAAVRQWRYQPTLLDGKPIEVQKIIDVDFRMPR